MASSSLLVLFFLFPYYYYLLLFAPAAEAAAGTATAATNHHEILQPYVVYMGSSSSTANIANGEGAASHAAAAELSHLQLLSSIIPRQESERISLIHSYNHAFRGFSAMLTEREASVLSGRSEIVSVFPDLMLQFHTTRSWDFLHLAESASPSRDFHYQHGSSDVIIGVIDTGIWPESPSFNDKGIGKIPLRWKGVCMEGPDFKKFNCNRKLIGARYYDLPKIKRHGFNTTSDLSNSRRNASGSPRDSVGHGTHTTSIAGGAVLNASYYGLARGTARGGLTSARIATYKACSVEGCSGSTILKAIDDAINDGVDIISISIGMSAIFQMGFLSDPIAIGAFHAEQMGVMVVCSGGNDGPDPYTVVNSAPWTFTVAASNIDRDFHSLVILGNGKAFHGSAINFSNLTRSERYPLAFGEDVAGTFAAVSDARNCYPGALDSKKVAGKIVVCVDSIPSVSRQIKKLVVEDAKAKGLILINEDKIGWPFDSGVFPFAEVGDTAGHEILNYINSTKNPTATILKTVDVPRVRPAPVVAYFSSRGPGGLTENILKPDIMAPGVAILAAMIPQSEAGSVPKGEKPSRFGIKSGTSMACPHVTGAAAFIKSVHRQWSSSMIKSALMTTASISNNMGKSLTNSFGKITNPHEIGVGEIDPVRALNPGLVFETTTTDYLLFLCYCGYSQKNIRSLSNTNFNCPKASYDELVSNINYPSISIGKLNRHGGAKMVKRTVTNVGSANTTYTATTHAPVGFVVQVLPKKIVFKEGLTKASFKASFYGKEAPKGYNFGSITWSDGLHTVRVVFAVNVE
ncbi:CO(2)-response secreted protease-like [Malania oleifera]|uniref:CO(2)-response secreted protease-like n=1 Tax=Malania oleifera TaxID=397392 RepID=UPI0025ADF679|nr:CO(2)-response secreted protease-like [Malania oleifera]